MTDNIQENTLLNIDFNAITPELVSYAKHRGLPIYAYTVETKKDMQDLMKMGLPGIITDYANWMETVPTAVTGAPERLAIHPGELTDPLTTVSTVTYRTYGPTPINGGIQLLGSNDGVASLLPSGQVLGVKSGTVTFQVYHDYQPFNIPVNVDKMMLTSYKQSSGYDSSAAGLHCGVGGGNQRDHCRLWQRQVRGGHSNAAKP